MLSPLQALSLWEQLTKDGTRVGDVVDAVSKQMVGHLRPRHVCMSLHACLTDLACRFSEKRHAS